MKEQVCTGLCLIGKCPNEECVKYKGAMGKAKLNAKANILSDTIIPFVKCDCQGKAVAVDIGTTTIVAYLLDMQSGNILDAKSRINSQFAFGTDVISRIKYANDNEKGIEEMQKAVVSDINELIEELNASNIAYMVITGNTAMLHILTKTPMTNMGTLPFEATSHFGYETEADSLGINSDAKVYLPPAVSAFVGSDVVTAALSCEILKKQGTFVVVDIGTNGEVMVKDDGGIVCASTAAGPAFEGAELSCGMAAVQGAVSHINAYKGKLDIQTIGDKEAKGLCGSGVLDALSMFLSAGIVDMTGRIDDEVKNEFLSEYKGKTALKIAENVYFTQGDIRKLQTAKSAITSGIQALLNAKGKKPEDVDEVYLAGGFGNYMDIESALKIGLLPRAFEGKIRSVKNAAGAGAIMCALDGNMREECNKIKAASKHLELATDSFFMTKYIDEMFFEG